MSPACTPSADNAINARLCIDFPAFSLDVDLSLPGTGITALFGASGAGKTTILRAIAGLERARNCRISIGDNLWQDDAHGIFIPTHRRPLGFVFQDVKLFDHLNVQQNLTFGMTRVPVTQRRIALGDAIDLLGIAHLLQRQPCTLSGGERQRVGIARALATSPRLLLLDEPLAALDMSRKAEVLPYLERLNAQLNIPMLYVSHALDEVARLSDHVVLLEQGRVLAVDSTHALLTRLDMPLAHGDTAAAIVEGRVLERDEAFHLCGVEFSGGMIFLPSDTLQIGQPIRLRIQARDVSLTLAPQTGTSVINHFETRVTGMSDDATGQVMVGLDAGGTQLLCRITKKSASTLNLRLGKVLFAQVKGVAVI